MIETSARIVAVTEHDIWVSAERRAACSACAGHAPCAGRWLSSLFPRPQPSRLDRPPKLTLNAGDSVQLSIRERDILLIAVVAYLLPLVMLIIGAAVTHTMTHSEWAVMGAAGAGFSLGLAITARLNHHIKPQLILSRR